MLSLKVVSRRDMIQTFVSKFDSRLYRRFEELIFGEQFLMNRISLLFKIFHHIDHYLDNRLRNQGCKAHSVCNLALMTERHVPSATIYVFLLLSSYETVFQWSVISVITGDQYMLARRQNTSISSLIYDAEGGMVCSSDTIVRGFIRSLPTFIPTLLTGWSSRTGQFSKGEQSFTSFILESIVCLLSLRMIRIQILSLSSPLASRFSWEIESSPKACRKFINPPLTVLF